MAAEGIRNLQDQSNELRLLVAPGKAACKIVHYEDDGVSQAYVKDFATTAIEKTVSGRKTVLTIGARQGSWDGAPSTRRISVVLEGVAKAPASVSVNGKAIEASAICTGGGKCVVILPEAPAASVQKVEITL